MVLHVYLYRELKQFPSDSTLPKLRQVIMVFILREHQPSVSNASEI